MESIKNKISNLYLEFDTIFGEWGWCSIEKSNKIIDCTLEVCSSQESPICVEIGVYGGRSIFPVLLSLKELNKGIAYAIDPWLNEEALIGYDHPSHSAFWGNVNLDKMYQIFLNGLKKLDVEKFTKIIKQPSDNAKKIENISILHIDGQHTDQVLRDINKYASNVIEGGYCFIDDVSWSEETLKSKSLMKSLGFVEVQVIGDCYLYKKQKTNQLFSINKQSKSTSWIVDGFYSDPDSVRNFALNQKYVEGGFGKGFIGRRTEEQFLFDGLKERFEEIMGKKITAWAEHGMNGRFQMTYAGEPLVWHCDSQTYGGMLYLTPNAPYECGTTLYAHKKTRARTYYDKGWDVEWGSNGGTTHLDGTPWEPVDVLGNVYNRLVIFDGSCIHSASRYFGSSKENCRLWQMFFFDTE